MSDIDEIALDVVKAIGNIDPDKLPGGRTQALAQAQILVRDAISGEVEALKAASRDLQDWFDDARATAEKCQARAAELEDLAVEAAQLFEDVRQGEYTVDSFTAQPYQSVQINTSSKPWLLRKQAEAVEAATAACEIKSATDDSKCYSPSLREHAQRLRQQADELETGKPGGEQ